MLRGAHMKIKQIIGNKISGEIKKIKHKLLGKANNLGVKRAVFSNFYGFSNYADNNEDRNYNTFAENGYIRNVIANYSAKLVAKSVASVPLLLSHQSQRGEREMVFQHPILELLRQPNPYTSGIDFMEHIAMHQMISGNAYILKIKNSKGDIKELYALRPDRITVEVNERGITGYKYTTNNKEITYKMDQINGECDVLHIRNFHPTNDVLGLSVFESASYSIEQHNQASVWTQALLKNSARPSGVLVVKNENGTNLTEEQYNKLKEQMDECFSGYGNAGRPMLLEGGLEWQSIGYKPVELDLTNSKNAMAREIALAFGVPSYLLGIPGDNTYNNLSEAKTILWEQTVLPMLTNILNYLGNWLRHDYEDKNFNLTYDIEKISIFAEHRERMFDKLNKVDFLTANEKRAILGFPPSKDM